MKNQSTKLSTKLLKSKNKNIGNNGYMVFRFYSYIDEYFEKKISIDLKFIKIYIYIYISLV